MKLINRKQFLQKSGVLAGSAILSHPLLSWGKQKTNALFDFHCHPAMFFTDAEGSSQLFTKVISAMKSANFNGAFVSIVSDWSVLEITNAGVVPTRQLNKGEAWNEYKKQLAIVIDSVAGSGANMATEFNHLSRPEEVNIFISVEGADFLEDKVENVDKAYEDGVRSIQLVHYAPNGLGDLQTAKASHNGLSVFGKEVVKRMTSMGMLIDVSHASLKTVTDVAESTGAPLLLSHSLLSNGSESPVSNRTISKEHASIIAETDGVIGAWPSGYSNTIDDFAENTIRLVEVVGADHVGLGTDMDANYNPVISDYSQVAEWMAALRSKGLSEEEVNKIAGGNAERLLKAVLK